GWNFIPNPFLSAVDINEMDFENVDATVYVHDNVSNKSFCYQKTVGEQAGFLSAQGTSYNPRYIAAGQSFFVHAKPEAAGRNGKVIFPFKSLTHGDEKTLLKSTTSGDNSVDKIVFNTSGSGGNFQSVIYFRENATTGFDSDFDAYLQETKDAGVLNFYSVGSNYFEPLMVNGLPLSVKQDGEIKLGYSTSTTGVYTLSLKKFTVNDVIVYLEDTENGTSTPLSAGFTCQVNVEKGTNNKRFKLVFRTNNAPVAKAQINDFETEAGKDFEYVIGTELFADNDQGDYVADVNVTAKDGGLLPSWLKYDYNNGKFIGNPAVEDAGRYNIEIVATDTRGAKSTPLNFAIVVTEPAPVVEPITEPITEPTPEPVPEPVTPPSGPVTITITRPTEDPVNNTENPEVTNPVVVTPNPSNLVTVEDPVMPIYVDPESPVTVEPYFPEVVDIEPVLPEVIAEPVQAEIPSDINPVLPEIIPEITPEPMEIQEPVVGEDTDMPQPDPVQFVENDEVFVPFSYGNIEADEDIKIYPVPSDGRVTVDFGSLIHETGSVQMTLITGSGRILTRKTVYDDSINLDLTGRTGIYLIRLVTPSKTITKRIIIQ
ncbi:MAG: T9SS type A sorting domain-containing protein, partial [Bacteroidales bacterium]|nr:T9SS type A sorting domain-containing protein [Bacteroidales bacterium]